MAQQSRQKILRVFLVLGALIVVAVLGVSLGWAGGSARADNGQSIILGVVCNGIGGTNCETNPTEVVNIGIGDGVQGVTDGSGQSGVYGVNDGTGGGEGVSGFSGTGNGVE